MVPAHIFREYDIRGDADRDLTDGIVHQIAQGIAWYLHQHGVDAIALGRDGRLHSPRIHHTLCRALVRQGISLLDVGLVPTPMLYFAIHHLGVQAGVQITGSHNPGPDNGFKIGLGTGGTVYGAALQQIRQRIEAGPFEPAHTPGQARPVSVFTPYIHYIASQLRLGPYRPQVALDAGNGAGGPIGLALLRRLGFPVVPLHCEIDGRFPHHHPDPTVAENLRDLQQAVAAHPPCVGLALDGDADRLGAVDETGRILWGDQLLLLLAKAVLREKPGARFVAEVKCSQVLYDEIAKAGGTITMARVGHSLIKQTMREVGADLAGELSGHLFFQHRYLGYDDGLYAACRLLEMLSHDPRPLSAWMDEIPVRYNTPEIRISAPDETKFAQVEQFISHAKTWPDVKIIDIDGARVEWSDGWALVRASNTQPALVLRFEAASPERMQAIRERVEKALNEQYPQRN